MDVVVLQTLDRRGISVRDVGDMERGHIFFMLKTIEYSKDFINKK